MKYIILLVEGKRVDRPSYMAGLSKKGFIVESSQNGSEAIKRLEKLKPNAIIIDAASMRTAGTRICTSIRNQVKKTPIFLILSADAKQVENTCADEVLYLPFTLQKLLKRIRPYMGSSKNKKLVCGPITLDLKDRWVTCGNKRTRLTPRLFILLESFMKKPGEVLLRED